MSLPQTSPSGRQNDRQHLREQVAELAAAPRVNQAAYLLHHTAFGNECVQLTPTGGGVTRFSWSQIYPLRSQFLVSAGAPLAGGEPWPRRVRH